MGEACIEVGAKKDRILDKLKDLKESQEQLFCNMKDIRFMQQLPAANKIA